MAPTHVAFDHSRTFLFRCWNQSEFGPFATWLPTEEQIEAARNQSGFYAKIWEEDFEFWLNYYLDHPEENGTAINDAFEPMFYQSKATQLTLDQAFGKALSRATGSSQCFVNRAGTTWFFFTIMTTIGTFLDS
jgi:hypothetical protein